MLYSSADTPAGETFEDWGWSITLAVAGNPSTAVRRTYADLGLSVLRAMGRSWPDVHSAKDRSVVELAEGLNRDDFLRLADAPKGWTFTVVRSSQERLPTDD